MLLPHPFVLTIATQAVIWALLAASWDLLSGYTGQISFGHAGFFALGAYAAAASTKHADVSPWLGLLVGATIAAAVGLLTGFPALRLRGHYLALVTLGLAEIIRLVGHELARRSPAARSASTTSGASRGCPTARWPTARRCTWSSSAIVVVSVAVMYQVCERTSAGQAFRAIREDEVLAQTLGIDTTRYKLLAFALSSGFAGLAGGLYAYYVQLVSPVVASAATTSLVIGMVVFGGLGTLWGPVLGALLLYGLYEGLRFVGVVYNLVAVGFVIMVFVIFFPRGLAGFGRSA